MSPFKSRSIWNSFTLFGLVIIAFSGCTTGAEPDLSDPEEQNDEPISNRPLPGDTIEILNDVDPAMVWQPPDEPGSVPVKVGIFLYAREGSSSFAPAHTLMRSSNILAQCDIRLELEVAHVLLLPSGLRSIRGNEQGSWGGHPPSGTENPALFNYQENNRLTQETRELFGYGKRYTSPNTIAVFIVEEIVYYSGGPSGSPSLVDGLSYAPNLYHHMDDYPLRNSVLLALPPSSNGLPIVDEQRTQFSTAHELGHMLLNTGLHNDVDPTNLMNGWGMADWTDLTEEQCERIRDVRARLYGEDQVHDPGPPSS